MLGAAGSCLRAKWGVRRKQSTIISRGTQSEKFKPCPRVSQNIDLFQLAFVPPRSSIRMTALVAAGDAQPKKRCQVVAVAAGETRAVSLITAAAEPQQPNAILALC